MRCSFVSDCFLTNRRDECEAKSVGDLLSVLRLHGTDRFAVCVRSRTPSVVNMPLPPILKVRRPHYTGSPRRDGEFSVCPDVKGGDALVRQRGDS